MELKKKKGTTLR